MAVDQRPIKSLAKKERTRQALVKVASSVLDAGEWHSTSVEAIAAAAGVVKATAFNAFGANAKDKLLTSIVMDFQQELNTAVLEGQMGSTMKQSIENLIVALNARRCLCEIVWRTSAAEGRPKFRNQVDIIDDLLAWLCFPFWNAIMLGGYTIYEPTRRNPVTSEELAYVLGSMIFRCIAIQGRVKLTDDELRPTWKLVESYVDTHKRTAAKATKRN